MNPAIQEFKDQLIPKIPDFFYDVNKRVYLIKQSTGENTREWVPLTDTQAARVLMLAGVRGVKNKTEAMSPATRLLCDATMSSEQTVHYSGPLAGYKEGLVNTTDMRILVTVGPRIIKPIKGSWKTIQAVLEGLLGEAKGVQMMYFYAWLKLSYIALRTADMRGMPAIALCGPADCGKSFIQQHLITPVLGGRVALPYAHMIGETPFNSDLFAAEHLAMGDENPSTDIRSRRRFGTAIKKFVAEETQHLRAKFCEAKTVRPFWRLSISLNDEPENIMTLPPFDNSMLDKLSLFHCRSFTWPMRIVEQSEKKLFLKQFTSEIPAFIHWLTELKLPNYVLGQRWTVATYHNPRILNCLSEVSPEFRLIELIKMCYFDDPVSMADSAKGKYGEIAMSALNLERGLTADESPVRYDARNLLSGGGRKLSAYLSRLSTRFPENIFMRRTSSERLWVLQNLSAVLASIAGEDDEKI